MDNTQKINELENKIEELTKNNIELVKTVEDIKNMFEKHTHNGSDGTKKISDDIEIDFGKVLRLGLGAIGSAKNSTEGTGMQIQTSISSGLDNGETFGDKSNNAQIDLLHQPNNTSNQSFLTGFRPPVYGNSRGEKISTTAGGNTITINGFNFPTNSLANALILIQNSSGSDIETRVIASNTSNVITINGTWSSTTAGGNYFIYQPIYFGSATYIWQRGYFQEGTGGGVRFGMGPTNGGQNGLLYMDAAGDLYWRNKSGTSTKLN